VVVSLRLDPMPKILLVEDDPDVRRMIEDWLASEGHVCDALSDGSSSFEYLRQIEYDLLILDWNLPGATGIEICTAFRKRGGNTPILFVTGKDAINEKLMGFDAGADDYLTKPFDLRELMARVRALLKRKEAPLPAVLRVRDLELNASIRKVTRAGEELRLKPQEFAVLEFLMRHQNEVFSIEALTSRIWPTDSEVSADTVRIHIMRLRQKIDANNEDRSLIRTVHKVGYVLES
jgi:DNA-binding response OmpR family regulator